MLKGKGDQPNFGRMSLHLSFKSPMITEMSRSRLARASGATAAAKAIAPQARTEKTVKKRILTEAWKGGLGG